MSAWDDTITDQELAQARRTLEEIGDSGHQAWMTRCYKPDRLEGRGERYAAVVRASHAKDLAERGYDCISRHDSVTGDAIWYPDIEAYYRTLRRRPPAQMFSAQNDTPLFSGAAQTVRPAPAPTPTPPSQPGLFACRFCQDTGRVRANGKTHFCNCGAGVKARASAGSKDLSS